MTTFKYGENAPSASVDPDSNADLSGPGDNPHSAGSPPNDLTGDTGRGFTSGYPLGYYTNPPVSAAPNPYAGPEGSGDGSGDTSATDYMRSNLDALYSHTVSNYTGSGTQPDQGDFNNDQGLGRSGVGQSV